MDDEKFKTVVKSLHFKKSIDKIKVDGNRIIVKWTNDTGKKKKFAAALGAATLAIAQDSPDFAEAAAKEFVHQWDTRPRGAQDDEA
ncbi:hypothetical protein [Prosthecomicrobium sp. N25]|uniref:hypothetical protein n=1 Tax=Prosthecomicrobium sp. N25 TaxID=3129254 RepID=UPI0030778788